MTYGAGPLLLSPNTEPILVPMAVVDLSDAPFLGRGHLTRRRPPGFSYAHPGGLRVRMRSRGPAHLQPCDVCRHAPVTARPASSSSRRVAGRSYMTTTCNPPTAARRRRSRVGGTRLDAMGSGGGCGAARALGHSNPRVTLETYAHVLPGMAEDAGQKLSALVLG